MIIQEKLKKWRTDSTKTLEQAANILGFSQSYLSMLETGEREISMAVSKAYLAAAPDYFTPNDFYGA